MIQNMENPEDGMQRVVIWKRLIGEIKLTI